MPSKTGPTRQDKTLDRMAQERNSPGATSIGVPGAEVGTEPTSDRRGDTAATAPKSREELIREAAYRRFEERGFGHGHHEDDWLEAEREVRPPDGN